MVDLVELRREIIYILNGLRFSVDRPVGFRGASEREQHLRIMLIIEEARIRFNSRTRDQRASVREFAEARDELLSFIKTFIEANQNNPKIFDRRFRIPAPVREIAATSFLSALYPVEGKDARTVGEALTLFRAYLAELNFATGPVQAELSFEKLETIVPHQQVAPVHFDVVDGRVVVVAREPRTSKADRKNIESALEHIRGSGDRLISNLENSNCDKRLLASVKELQSQLVSNGNIVKIGLSNMTCGTMGARFHNELPEAVVAMFNDYNTSVSIYVAQFPEWEQFTQKAALIELDAEDVTQVEDAADEVIDTLRKNPALTDPEVPKTIAFVRQFMQFPGTSSKRAAFAMIRTIENLVSSILRHSMLLVSKTAEKVADAGATVASTAIVGLLSIALASATGIGPAAVRAGAPWVQQAAEIVLKQLEKMGHAP